MNKLIYWILLICGLLIVLGVCSCRSVKKSSKSHTVKSDSSATIRENRTVETTDNSTVVEEKKEKSDKDFEVTIEYEPKMWGEALGGDSVKLYPESDGKVWVLDTVTGSITRQFINKLLDRPIKKVTVKGTINSTADTKTTTQNDKKESAKTEQKTDTKVEKKDEQKEKDKSVKGIPVSVTISAIFIILGLLAAYAIIRIYFPNFLKFKR